MCSPTATSCDEGWLESNFPLDDTGVAQQPVSLWGRRDGFQPLVPCQHRQQQPRHQQRQRACGGDRSADKDRPKFHGLVLDALGVPRDREMSVQPTAPHSPRIFAAGAG